MVIEWPSNKTLYRGTRIPKNQLLFFTKNKKYRCPMLLASSTLFQTAKEFRFETLIFF